MVMGAVSLGVGVASSLAGHSSAKKQARKEERNRIKAARIQQGHMIEEAKEVRKQTTEDLFQLSRQTMARRGAAAVSASDAGVAGLGISLLDQDIAFEGRYNRAITRENSAARLRQIKREFDAAIPNAKAGVVSQRPNPLATGLQIIGEVADFFNRK